MHCSGALCCMAASALLGHLRIIVIAFEVSIACFLYLYFRNNAFPVHKHTLHSGSHPVSEATFCCLLQGNCSEPIPANITESLSGPALVPRKPGQCLVVFFGNGLSVVSEAAQNLWIDGLYLRQTPLEDPPDTESTILTIDRVTFGAPLQHAPSVWLSNVTIQGSGAGDVRGLAVSSKLVAEGVRYAPQLPLFCETPECLPKYLAHRPVENVLKHCTGVSGVSDWPPSNSACSF